jgi:two-component system copper resistance phosphate regulon response regulator CusR
VKPFAFAELVARIRALVRRGRSGQEAPRLGAGDLEMDLITRRVTRGGETVELTVREFELLEFLLRHQGQVVSRETLARDVWQETARTTPLDNVIDVHIARLRRKVDAEQRVKLIHTVRGVGFMLREGEP